MSKSSSLFKKGNTRSFITATFFLILVLLPAGAAHAGTLSCSITTAAACTGGTNTIILRMSGTGNAHAELPSQANYTGSVVCCSGVTGLGNSCSGTFATVLKLSGTSNAHVEQNSQANYANSACISVASGSVSVGYQATNCTGFDTTLASLSGITNAHVGNSAAYPSIQICATAAGTPPPTLTTYTNGTETALNYAAACTGCGARIGPTSAWRQSVTITGTNFGADPGVGNYSTATNNVKVGAQQIATSNVTAWSATSITFLTDTNVAGDADSDWGADFGGASALTVTAGGATATGLNFYVFPQVTSIDVPTAVSNAAREYNAADSDGVITLNGTRFGTALGTGYVQILGCSATTCTSPTDSATTNSWSNTAVAVQVPAVIDNATYTGSVVMKQGTGSNTKTHTPTASFRILPRITGFTPGSGSPGDAVTVNGDHFCQVGAASCPSVFSAANKVTFTSAIDAVVFTSWTSTAMATQVPASAATGNVVLTSNTTYTSNGKSFTIVSPTPSDPTSLNQYKNSGLTQAIVTGATASSTPIYLTMTMVTGVSGGTLYPQIEYKAIGTAFACSGTSACGSATTGTGVAGPGPIDCAVVGNACAISVSPADDVYHWQARVKHTKNAVDYYSVWVSFPTPSANLESETDVKIDTTGPVITNISSGTPGSNTATITWDTSGETSTSQVQYNTTGTFVDNCATNNDCTTFNASLVFSHSVGLANLDSGTTYYYRVRSKDAAGNETMSGNNTFATASVSQPAKTVSFTIGSTGTVISGGSATTTVFSITMPENATSTKSIFVEIDGVYVSGASANNITVQFNSESSKTYTIPISSTSHFKILHPVSAIAVSPATNTLTITAQANVSMYALSALITVTYAYTP